MKTDTKRTKTKPRARKMWANYYGDFVACHNTRSSAMREGDHHEQFIAVPVAVIPLDDVPALVQIARDAVFRGNLRDEDSYAVANRMLTAIGVLPRQRKGGRK